MNTFIRALMATTLLTVTSFSAFSREHGGGNGGDDLELELKKIALQIGYFVKSEMGSKIFKNLNPEAVIDTVNTLDIDVVSDKLTDKYGVERTCLNFPDRQLITCNIMKLNHQKKDNIFVGLIFHEILGLMELELGHMENVSQYPVSSKILPYTDIVLSTPIAEAQIRPEFYGLDNRSYGVTIVNQDTKETLRLICLNDNVEIHRCRNYSLVRQAQGLQSPAIPEILTFNPDEIRAMPLKAIMQSDVDLLFKNISENEKNGYKYLTYAEHTTGGCYIYGGNIATAQCHNTGERFATLTIGLIFPLFWPDHLVEAGKQVGNVVVYPFKAIKTYFRSSKMKKSIKEINKNIELAKTILNTQGKLNLVGTTKNVSDKDFNTTLHLLTLAGYQIKNKTVPVYVGK